MLKHIRTWNKAADSQAKADLADLQGRKADYKRLSQKAHKLWVRGHKQFIQQLPPKLQKKAVSP